MSDERQTWDPWMALSPPSGGENGALVRSGMDGRIVAECERHEDAIKAAADHNALLGIPDPAEWRRQSRELAEVVDRLWEERDERVREGLICDAIARADDLLALDPTHE